MTKDVLKLALEALEEVVKWYQVRDKNDEPLPVHNQNPEIKASIEAISAIKEALMLQSDGAKPEPWEKFCDSNCVWTNHHPDCKLAQIEPVAWLHRFIEGGISIGLKPADLERHPERWEPLYTEPKPCPTCEALARTVMLDQTSHDTTPPQRKPLSDEEIRKANHHMVEGAYAYSFKQGVKWAEYKHGIKGEA